MSRPSLLKASSDSPIGGWASTPHGRVGSDAHPLKVSAHDWFLCSRLRACGSLVLSAPYGVLVRSEAKQRPWPLHRRLPHPATRPVLPSWPRGVRQDGPLTLSAGSRTPSPGHQPDPSPQTRACWSPGTPFPDGSNMPGLKFRCCQLLAK